MRLSLLLISSLLIGCQGVKIKPVPEPVVITRIVKPDCGTPPPMPVMDLKPVVWQVIDEQFALSAANYENLSFNMSQIKAGIKNLLVIKTFFEQCVTTGENDE